MAKHSVKKQALGWIASTITDADLTKDKEEGFLAASAELSSPAPRSSLNQSQAIA
jgi:hypothetical protein